MEIRNPILSGFYPDPSICRVDNDCRPYGGFYLVNSTFAYFPGIPIFHSADLRSWRQIGSAIDRPGQICFDGHTISQGLFAPTIRYNRGVFYILCTLIHTGGNFVITARDPAGPWSDPVWLAGAEGIDPSIFFDDDGETAWYTGTRPAPEGEAYPGNYEIYIQRMDLSLLEAGKNPLAGENGHQGGGHQGGWGIWRGALRGAVWPEGPHIYKVDGWYYLLYAEGGTGLDHAVCAARAKDIRGPWEGKKSNPVLTHRHLGKNAAIINAGHGDLFDDTAGEWRMVLLASRPVNGVCPLGRETFMVPVFWEDGWPFVGTKSGLIEETFTVGIEAENGDSVENGDGVEDGDGVGDGRDYFNGKLPLHWLTLRMPARAEDAALSLTARPSALRLFTRAETTRGLGHHAFAGRRLRHHDWAFSAAIEFAPRAGEAAGLILLQSEDWQYRFEIFLADSGRPALRLIRAAGGREDEIIAEGELPAEAPQGAAVLAARCEKTSLSFFCGSPQALKPFASRVDGRILSGEYAGGFVGTLAGVFATGNGRDTGGYADALWAEYTRLPVGGASPPGA